MTHNFGINIGGQLLDFYPKTALNFELNNPAYLGDEIDVIQNAFMFTIKVPLTSKNKRLLAHPDRVDNAHLFLKNTECAIYTQGVEVFRGLLSVRSSRQKEAEVSVAINALSALRENQVNQLWQETYPLAYSILLGYAYATCQYPMDYDFIFHPVFNEGFNTDEKITASGKKWQNAVVVNGGNASLGLSKPDTHSAMTPFFRLDRTLKKIVESQSFSLENNFQTTTETKLLTLYNNRTLINWTSDTEYTAASSILSARHLPQVKASEWLKNIARQYNLGIYTNFFDKTVELLPNENILGSPVVIDWSRKQLSEKDISESLNFPTIFNYDENKDGLPAYRLKKMETPERDFKAVYMSPPSVSMHFDPFINAPISAPKLSQEGSWLYFDVTKNKDFEPRLMLYRGLADNVVEDSGVDNDGNPFNNITEIRGYPLAACETTDANGAPVKVGWNSTRIPGAPVANPIPATLALHWSGNKSIFKNYWENWYTLLQNKRDVKTSLGLSLQDIRQFSFKNRISMGNKAYIVKRLRITLTETGIAPTEAELVTTV
jgi:hypothetical protein